MTQQSLPDPAPVDPTPLYDVLHSASVGIKRFQALRAALRLGLFERLEEACDDVTLAGELGLDPVLTSAFCALLADMRLLIHKGKAWQRTQVATCFLDSRSPYYLGEMLRCMADDISLWEGLENLLRNGPLDLSKEQVFQGSFLEALARESLLGEVQKTADLVAAMPGFASARRALDLGGGHGLYAMALCERNPTLRAIVFDTPTACAATKAYIREFGAERMTAQAGDLFQDDWGADYDLVFFSYNPGGKQKRILQKIYASLAPGGLFVTKHAFYGTREGSKDALLDMEWLLTRFPGIGKAPNVYRFAGDLSREAYLAFLIEHYELLLLSEARQFAPPALGRFGDRLDSHLIICRKRGESLA
jgi:predicted O-methyltransferase YrrM